MFISFDENTNGVEQFLIQISLRFRSMKIMFGKYCIRDRLIHLLFEQILFKLRVNMRMKHSLVIRGKFLLDIQLVTSDRIVKPLQNYV